MITVQLPHCRVEYDPANGLRTVFDDGTEWGAFPSNDPHYHVIAHRCGYGDDLWRYCFEHEVAHSFLASESMLPDDVGVVWRLAHRRPPHAERDAIEEIVVQTFQRCVRANERPIIGGIDWDDLKARFLALVDA